MRILLNALLLVCVTTAVVSSEKSLDPNLNVLHKRALALLTQYNLNPVNKTSIYIEPKSHFLLPLERIVILDSVDSDSQKTGNNTKLVFTLLQSVSEKIGLNPSLFIGKPLIRLNYVLLDSSQGNKPITAHILFSDTILAGASLFLDGYYPGVAAINDHSEFIPKNFTFPIFRSDLLDTVAIFGPWDKSGKGCNWINKVDNLSGDELSYFANTFSSGRKVEKELMYCVRDPIEEYAVYIRFKSGEQYNPHFILRNDTVFLDAYKCYYILDRKFIDFVKGIIKSRGISKCK